MVDQSDLNKQTNGLMFKMSFYGQALFAKIIPCILVVTFISMLIHSLLIVKRNKRELKSVRRKVTILFKSFLKAYKILFCLKLS